MERLVIAILGSAAGVDLIMRMPKNGSGTDQAKCEGRAMPQKYVPTDAQLIKMAAEAVKSAANKQDTAAKVLDAGGDPSSAFALAALGLEELGKSFVCSTVLSRPVETRAKDAALMLASHAIKMQVAVMAIRVFVDEADLPDDAGALFAQITATATSTNAKKFDNLYVDAVEDGVTIRTPNATVDDARALADLLGSAISALTEKDLTLTGEEDPARFRTLMDHLNTNREPAERLLDEDPLAFLGGFRAMTRGEAVPEWLIEMAPPDVAEGLR